MKRYLAKTLVRVADRLDQLSYLFRSDTLRECADSLTKERVQRMREEAQKQGHYLDVFEGPEGVQYRLSGPWVENYLACVEAVPKIDDALRSENTERTISSLVRSAHLRVLQTLQKVEKHALPGEFVQHWKAPRQVTFFATSDASEQTFNKVMSSQYDLVLDIRKVPRFDYGRNTRKSFFEKLGSGEYRLSKYAPPPVLNDGEKCQVLVLCQTEEDLKPFIKSWFGYSSPYWCSRTFKENT